MKTRIAIATVAALATSALGDYAFEATVEGSQQHFAAPGDTFVLDLWVESDALDQHNSAIFRFDFNIEGLWITSFSWELPYEMTYDNSRPDSGDLPLQIDQSTFYAPEDPDAIDIRFSNVVPLGQFAEGAMLHVSFQVPEFPDADRFVIDVVPDTIANGFEEIPTTGGEPVTIIVPGPAVIAVLGLGLVFMRRRPSGTPSCGS